MLVIGSRTSSNTMKLYEIAGKNCKKTYLIETIEDLPLNEVEKCGTIGIAAGASAPECIIKEVIATMSEFITENGLEQNEMLAYMEDIEKALRLPGRGEIVTGDIIAVSDREIVVNLGCKKDGIIPKDEVTLEPGQKLSDVFKAGEQIEAKVVKTKDDDGNILLSKKKLEVNEHWNEVNEALDNKTVVNAKVTGKVKGGVIATFKEVSGFIPLSQLSDKFTEEVDEFIGKTIPVKVIQTNPKRNRAVFSHRAVLMEEKAKKTEAFWNSIEVDDIVDGVVKRFTDYGAFVDIGGVDGLLHISEISWGKIKKPQDVLELEQQVKVKILSMNKEKGKISLGLKQTQPEPWENIESKYQVGDIIEGKVVQLKDYGAFIEIEPGLDGLVHISEIAYKRVANPANEIEIGQTVNAKILDIDTEKKRISLSIKETLEKPVAEEAPVEEAPAEEAPAEEATEETAENA
jgi:4-hydroxy-3-methylbut-2-enyl diphosphate reductase